MQPDIEHENLALAEIFSPEVIAHTAALLADFRESNPVINNYHDYFSGRGTKQRQREEVDWMRSLHLIPNLEVECVFVDPRKPRPPNKPICAHQKSHQSQIQTPISVLHDTATISIYYCSLYLYVTDFRIYLRHCLL
jgi:hypothetical protein